MIQNRVWSMGVLLAGVLTLAAGVAGCSSEPTGASPGSNTASDAGSVSGKPVLTLKGAAR